MSKHVELDDDGKPFDEDAYFRNQDRYEDYISEMHRNRLPAVDLPEAYEKFVRKQARQRGF